MTPRQADRLIASGEPTTFHNATWGETFIAVLVGRDRWNVFTSDGGVFDRKELAVVTH